MAAYVGDEDAWARVPMMPPPRLLSAGRLVHLVASTEGSLRRIRHRSRIERLASLAHFAPKPSEVGAAVVRTTCFNSAAGECHLLHPDRNVVARDYATLRALQPSLFAVERRLLTRLAQLRLPSWGHRRVDGLYLRRGYVVQTLQWSGNRRYASGQMVVEALEMDPGASPVDGSMAGVRRVRFLSPGGEVTCIDARRVRPPQYELVTTV